jgi:hypothetical protein
MKSKLLQRIYQGMKSCFWMYKISIAGMTWTIRARFDRSDLFVHPLSKEFPIIVNNIKICTDFFSGNLHRHK